MRRARSASRAPRLPPITTSAASAREAATAATSSTPSRMRLRRRASSRPWTRWSYTLMLAAAAGPSAGAVSTTIEAAPNWDTACKTGLTIARAVAAIMTEIRSFAISAGRPQPNTASPAAHGVSRSIWARTMPSRNSTARRGNSSWRKTKRDGRSTISTRLPRIALATLSGSAGAPALSSSRKRSGGDGASFGTRSAKPSSSSTTRTTRGDTKRPSAATSRAATASSQRETSSAM